MSGAGLAALDPNVVEAVRPITLSREHLLEVPEALAPLFPGGGLQHGWSVGVSGPGSWTLVAAMVAPSLGDEGWMAVIGAPSVNLVAGAEVGLRMDRVLVVDTPPAGQWGAVVAALLEAVQVVVVNPATAVGGRDARRIVSRLREQRGILIHLDGGVSWPIGLDMNLSCSTVAWEGIGNGHGYLRFRQLVVEGVGRRSASRPRSVSIWMPGPDGPLHSDPTAGSEPIRFPGTVEHEAPTQLPAPWRSAVRHG